MFASVSNYIILSKTAIHGLSPKLWFAEALSHRRAQKKLRLNDLDLVLLDIGWGMFTLKAELLSFATDYCSRRCSSSSLWNSMFLGLFWHKGHAPLCA